MEKICLSSFPTPYFLVDEQRLRNNLAVLQSVCSRTGCKILLAQKAFSMYSTYPIIREYLAGTTASGLYEAKLGHDYFGGETHVFSPAYREQEFCELLKVADDFVFNSPTQLKSTLSVPKMLGNRSDCALIPNVRLRKAMQSTTHAHPAPDLEPPLQILTSRFCLCWMVCTFTPCANRIRMT